MSYTSITGPKSSSESSDEDDSTSHSWYHNKYGITDYQPRKKRRIQRDSKEKAALGVFGSESEDDVPGKRWMGKSHLRKKGVSFVSTNRDRTQDQENRSLIFGKKYIKQEDLTGPHQEFTKLRNNSSDRNIISINSQNFTKTFETGHSATKPTNSASKSTRLRNNSSQDLNDVPKTQDATAVNSKASFAARMMAKMGYKDGEGLGKEGQGRNSAIEVTLRPQGVGLGAITEKSKQEIEEERRQAKARGIHYQSPEKEQKKVRFKLQALELQYSDEEITSRQKKVKKSNLRTLVQIQNAAPGLQVPDSFARILDMTVQGQGNLTSITEIANPMIESETKEHSEKRKLALHAEKDLSAYVEEWKHLEEKKSHIKLVIAQQHEHIKEEQQRLDHMLLLAKEFHSFSQLVENMRWDHVFRALESSNFMTNSELSGKFEDVSKIAVAAVHPILRRAVEEWKPLDDPELGGLVPKLLKIRKALGFVTNGDNSNLSRSIDNEQLRSICSKSSTTYESMIFKIIYPKILNSIEKNWDVYDPFILQNLLDTWQDLLPSFLRTQILNQTVVRKLNSAVTSWNPKNRKAHELPHLWLFPWLQYLPAYHANPQNTNGLVSNIRRKFRQLVDSWDFHRGVVPGLHQWRDVLHASSKNDQWTPLIMNHVLPSMSRFLSNEDNFKINPNDQSPFMSSLQGILEWQDVLKSRIVAQVIVDTVFPLWHNVLHQWLTLTGPNEEIGLWFEWWKNDVFPNEIKSINIIQDEFNKGHEMIKQALDLGPNVAELLPAPVTQNRPPDIPLAQILSPAPQKIEPNSFKSMIEDWCVENDLQFLPEKNIFHPAGPLHRITAAGNGKNGALVYIKGDKIWALSRIGMENTEIEITWESIDSKDLLLGMAWQNVK